MSTARVSLDADVCDTVNCVSYFKGVIPLYTYNSVAHNALNSFTS